MNAHIEVDDDHRLEVDVCFRSLFPRTMTNIIRIGSQVTMIVLLGTASEYRVFHG